MQNEKIKFKPLHEGVGFHPFSEGLPYAPQTKSETKPRPTAPSITPDYSKGIGAMSAGAPSFTAPKTTRQIQQQNNLQVSTKAATPVAAPLNDVRPSTPQGTLLRKRFFAYLMDTVVHLGFWITINLIAILGFQFELDTAILAENWIGFSAFFAFSQWFFIAMQELLFENSIGKFFFSLEFKRNRKSFFASSLLIRSIVFMMGVLVGGIGLYFRPQDKIAEIQLRHP